MRGTGKADVAITLTARMAQAIVRAVAMDTGNVIWTRHIIERMDQRGFDSTDVLEILRKGTIDDDPIVDDRKPGQFKVKVTKTVGGREAGVVGVLVSENKKIKLLTAEWEDGR
jgi:Domain of unknown function (DUF4258)